MAQRSRRLPDVTPSSDERTLPWASEESRSFRLLCQCGHTSLTSRPAQILLTAKQKEGRVHSASKSHTAETASPAPLTRGLMPPDQQKSVPENLSPQQWKNYTWRVPGSCI